MKASDIRTLAAQVLASIAPEADLSAVADSDNLREALDLDSMDFLNFIIGLSTGSGTAIAEVDYPRLVTLEGVIHYLSHRLEGQAPGSTA